MKKTLLTVAIGAALTASSALAATLAQTSTVTTYSNSGAWAAGVGTPTSTETFTGTKQTFTTFTLAGGLPDNYNQVQNGNPAQFYQPGTNTSLAGYTSGNASHAFINAAGQWQDVVDNFTAGGTVDFANVRTTTFSFTPSNVATPLFGIGFTFNEGSAGAGSGALITLNFSDGSSKVVQTLSGISSDTFFGYVSNTAFNSITISSANQGSFNQETFTLDNLTFAQNACVENCTVTDPPSTTPEPTTFSLIGAALAGLGLVARRRRS